MENSFPGESKTSKKFSCGIEVNSKEGRGFTQIYFIFTIFFVRTVKDGWPKNGNACRMHEVLKRNLSMKTLISEVRETDVNERRLSDVRSCLEVWIIFYG